ncbi:RNA polymerase sigma factor [Pedobacter sp. SYP-B3415]|uniref:RNA polymerase sigma factor n=1 Tax=Pedobacter sp. SYP-B3415 TaxID=2496641 RepID=UPI00101D8D65|nr:sigma-70 family RNA polymerase sigma factor [Pedobacter sp. SYP-B3415]
MRQQPDDITLIQSVLAGHTDQYALLVAKHQRFVFTLAIRFVKTREDAEEVAQDCFIKAYKALGSFKQDSKFSTWLYTITYTTAMTFLRKKRIDTTSIDDENTFAQVTDRAADTGMHSAERKSRNFYLQQAIEALQPDDAAIIGLFYQGEQSLEEIGGTLKMSANTVKVKLHRARQRLKEKLHELLKDEVNELI